MDTCINFVELGNVEYFGENAKAIRGILPNGKWIFALLVDDECVYHMIH